MSILDKNHSVFQITAMVKSKYSIHGEGQCVRDKYFRIKALCSPQTVNNKWTEFATCEGEKTYLGRGAVRWEHSPWLVWFWFSCLSFQASSWCSSWIWLPRKEELRSNTETFLPFSVRLLSPSLLIVVLCCYLSLSFLTSFLLSFHMWSFSGKKRNRRKGVFSLISLRLTPPENSQ